MSALRKGLQVYFTHPVKPADPNSMLAIVTGTVSEVVWPGTTNEYVKVVIHNSNGVPSSVEKKSEECFLRFHECREHAILEVYEQLDRLSQQLRALGDHV